MKYTHKKKNKKEFAKYISGELVICEPGYHHLWTEWLRENGYVPNGQGRMFSSSVQGKFLKTSPDSGPLYKIVEINGEQFEIFHVSIKKVNQQKSAWQKKLFWYSKDILVVAKVYTTNKDNS